MPYIPDLERRGFTAYWIKAERYPPNTQVSKGFGKKGSKFFNIQYTTVNQYVTGLYKESLILFIIYKYLTEPTLWGIIYLLAKSGRRVILLSSLGPSLVEGLTYGSVQICLES